jgi:ABC-2 type transport system ATP-binding protein
MIEVTELTKKYGNHIVVDNVSFCIKQGDIVGFLGPNGAGKTTTMNMITGFLSPTVGEIYIDGINLFDNPLQAKAKIGYLPEQPPLYYDLTVTEYLQFLCDVKKVQDSRTHISEICRSVKITDVKKRVIKNLSKGFRQRVGIAGALIGDPEILILDEPTVGLDPVQILDIRNFIKEIGKNKTVILSSHILYEISQICTRVLIINDGRLIMDSEPGILANRTGDLEQAFLQLIQENTTGEKEI